MKKIHYICIGSPSFHAKGARIAANPVLLSNLKSMTGMCHPAVAKIVIYCYPAIFFAGKV